MVTEGRRATVRPVPAADRRMAPPAAAADVPAPAVPWPKRARRTLRYLAIRAALFLVRVLPLGVARALGRLGGALAARLLGRDRRLALAHLDQALPELGRARHEAIVREMFRGFGEMAAELALVHRLDRDLLSYVEVPPEDEQRLRDAVAGGRGAIVVTGHIGSWELLFRRFVRAGFPAYAVGKESHDPRLTALVDRLRGEGRTIWRGQEGAAKQLLKVLRGSGVLAMLIDQDTKVQGVFVPFFGEPAHTPRAAADLALRSGAVVLAAFIHRKPGGGHRVSLRPVPHGEPTGDREADTVALTAAMTAAIEAEIRAVPADWVWHHRRWKTRPPA